jgi:hypothetical protein
MVSPTGGSGHTHTQHTNALTQPSQPSHRAHRQHTNHFIGPTLFWVTVIGVIVKSSAGCYRESPGNKLEENCLCDIVAASCLVFGSFESFKETSSYSVVSIQMASAMSMPASLPVSEDAAHSAADYAWSLFYDIDFSDNTDVNITDRSGSDPGGSGSDVGGAKRKYQSDGNGYTSSESIGTGSSSGGGSGSGSSIMLPVPTASTTKKASKSRTKKAKQAPPPEPPPVEPDPMPMDPETMRIRELLEERARAVLTQHVEKMGNPRPPRSPTATSTSSTPSNTEGLDPLQYYRMMATALNAGCFSDLRDCINRVFAPNCSYRIIAIPVRRGSSFDTFHYAHIYLINIFRAAKLPPSRMPRHLGEKQWPIYT